MFKTQDRFIIFLSLSFIFIVLMARYSFIRLVPIASFSGPEGKKVWRINQEQALRIVSNQREVRELIERGRTRKEDEFGIVISQPKVTLKASPKGSTPYWEFQVYEEMIEIPKEGSPSSQTATLNWYQVSAETGKVEKTF
jgi:hypothetical protein